ncbi:MAG: rod shape-determining protein MreC [Magnetococcales bacterium]|nr:rod shape-determining protein MreC [Magnetococcales bacterium]
MVELFALLKQYRNGLVAILVLVVALVLMLSVRSHDPGRRDLISDTVLDAVGPIQRVLLSPVVVYRQTQARITELRQLDQENTRMKAELKRLRPLGTLLEELAQENRRLHQLLNIPVDSSYYRIAARVVGDSSSAFARSLLINAGREEGVVVNATVVVPEGLLGRVVRVGAHTSLVLTLLDLNSRIPVVVQRSRERAIAAGFNGRKLQLEFVSKVADIEMDDRIITSGTGEGFPKGLVVGRVQQLISGGSGLFRQVTVVPAVDFDRAEEVVLLIPLQTKEAEALPLPDDALPSTP